MNKSTLMAANEAPAAFAGDKVEHSGPTFEAINVAYSGTVHVDASTEQAFQLFTAPGEKLWAHGWDPVVFGGSDGRSKGAIFVTTHHHERTIWVVVDYQPDSLHVRYARMTPASHAGTVEVFVRSDGQGGAEAEVTYELTALNETGNQDLAEFDAQEFSHMMEEWEETIRVAKIDLQAHFEQ